MMFERIDALVHDFEFQSWNDRYSKGVWAALGPREGALTLCAGSQARATST